MNDVQKAWVENCYADAKLAYAALMKFYPLTPENLPGENWRDIEGYDGNYQESNYGRTKSFQLREPRILRPYLTKNGYLAIKLQNRGIPKHHYIHQLVGKAFISNPDNLPEINHEDGCKLNNYVGNLNWITHSDNHKHAHSTGLYKSGSERSDARLTKEQVKYIRKVYRRYSKKSGAHALARKFGVGYHTILHVVRRDRYKDVD